MYGMNLHNVRDAAKKVLEQRAMTQEAFARKYDLSSSWFNKFLRGEIDNPRIKSVERVQDAIDSENGQ